MGAGTGRYKEIRKKKIFFLKTDKYIYIGAQRKIKGGSWWWWWRCCGTVGGVGGCLVSYSQGAGLGDCPLCPLHGSLAGLSPKQLVALKQALVAAARSARTTIHKGQDSC